MINSIKIKNYKSIEKVEINLGRINVFIGENGAGKSNILEAIALAGAASADKLDNEFLSSRGIRVTRPEFMRSALVDSKEADPISISVIDENKVQREYLIRSDDAPYPTWQHTIRQNGTNIEFDDFTKFMFEYLKRHREKDAIGIITRFQDDLKRVMNTIDDNLSQKRRTRKIRIPLNLDDDAADMLLEMGGTSMADHHTLEEFIIYSPENTALRMFEREGQIQPLGINGEGLLKLLTVMSQRDKPAFEHIKKCLKVFGWFEDFSIAEENGTIQMAIQDGFIQESLKNFDQRSANEGFLFVAFYFSLFSSKLTPKFFAIDNIDASLNPKLCQELMRNIANLSREHQKQVILTTHNPAILDGMNLNEDDQRLFIISRGRRGETRVRNFKKPLTEEKFPTRMSELFLRGALGGLPKGF